MAMIDSSIAMGVKPMQIESPMNALAQAMQLKQLQQQGQMGEMQMQERQRGVAADNALAQLLAGGKSGADVSTGLASQGYGKQALDYTKQMQAAAKDKAAAEKEQLSNTMTKLSLGAQLLGGVTDQASYDAARATAQANGLDVSRMQPNYDPAFVAQKLKEGLTVKEQLEQYWKQKGYDTPDANAVLQANTSTANNANTVGAIDRATQSRANIAINSAAQKAAPKPMPAAALKMQQEGLDAIGTASSINADLGAIDAQITNGTLKFGPVGNLVNRALNASGMSTDESRNFASFQANMEKLRNDSLRLNKGVQTEGDSQRAWNELFSNINDAKVVQQRLGEIQRINERAVQLRKLDIDNVRSNYGYEPMDSTAYTNQPAALNGGKAAPTSNVLGMEAELRRRGLLK